MAVVVVARELIITSLRATSNRWEQSSAPTCSARSKWCCNAPLIAVLVQLKLVQLEWPGPGFEWTRDALIYAMLAATRAQRFAISLPRFRDITATADLKSRRGAMPWVFAFLSQPFASHFSSAPRGLPVQPNPSPMWEEIAPGVFRSPGPVAGYALVDDGAAVVIDAPDACRRAACPAIRRLRRSS